MNKFLLKLSFFFLLQLKLSFATTVIVLFQKYLYKTFYTFVSKKIKKILYFIAFKIYSRIHYKRFSKDMF
jgi:hypothetical protein